MMKNQYDIDFEYIKENLNQINANIKSSCEKADRNVSEITLIGVTKTVDTAKVNYSIENGINVIGENKVQEFLSKKDDYINECKVHFIGNLQTNKVKYICSFVDVIESVNSLKLLIQIDKECKKINKTMPVFIEVNVGEEETKSGIDYLQVEDLINQAETLDNVVVKGLMAIPPYTTDENIQRQNFKKMKALFDKIKKNRYNKCDLEFLSMGMSSDYKRAIEEGANIIRLGTCLYGKRDYNI